MKRLKIDSKYLLSWVRLAGLGREIFILKITGSNPVPTTNINDMDKYKRICPNCHSELHGDEYDEVTEYHNSLTGRCNKCGHTDHWMSFFG